MLLFINCLLTEAQCRLVLAENTREHLRQGDRIYWAVVLVNLLTQQQHTPSFRHNLVRRSGVTKRIWTLTLCNVDLFVVFAERLLNCKNGY